MNYEIFEEYFELWLLFDGLLYNVKSLFDYVDAYYGQDLDKRKSTTGYMFTLDDGSIS